MATKNPRVSVMLKPESDAILTRLSAATKQSKSAIIAEFLEDTCMPMFERMVIVLEAAATATDDAKAAAKQGFADAEQKLLGVVGMTTDIFDGAARTLVEHQKAPGGRALSDEAPRPSEAADGPARPPHVTRGSGTPNTSDKKSSSPMKTGAEAASQYAYDSAGMKWWNKLSEKQRAEWLDKAGSAAPADAYAVYLSECPSEPPKRPSKARSMKARV